MAGDEQEGRNPPCARHANGYRRQAADRIERHALRRPAAVPAEIAQDADAGAVRIHVRQLRAFADGLKTSAGGAGYDQNSLRNFLAQVAFLLRADDPPLKFNWSKVDPAAAGQCALFAVIDLIAAETTTFDEKRANEK